MSEKRAPITHLLPEALVAATGNGARSVEVQLAWYLDYYKVLGIMNTTILKPGEWLSVEAVDQLCNTRGWTVKMGDNDVISTLVGLGTGIIISGSKL